MRAVYALQSRPEPAGQTALGMYLYGTFTIMLRFFIDNHPHNIMPKEGFRSITIPETVYDRFHTAYTGNKAELAIRGIRSLSGYLTRMLEERMRSDEAVAEYTPRMKKVSVDDGRAVLLDRHENRIAEVVVQDGSLYCQLCEVSNCLHVGFAHSLPEVYAFLGQRGAEGSPS